MGIEFSWITGLIVLIFILLFVKTAINIVVILKDWNKKTFILKTDESTKQLQALLDSIPYLAWLKDSEGKFLTVNKAFADAVDKEPSEIIGQTDIEVWPREFAEKYMVDDLELMRKKEKFATEESGVCNGMLRWIETYKAPILNEKGDVIGTAGISRDISDRKKELTELVESRNKITEANEREILKLIEINEIKESFISTLAHDLMVPFIGEKKVLEFLLSRPDIKYKEMIENLYLNNESIISQLKKLLEIYYYETKKKIIYKEKRNINESIRKVIVSLKKEINEKNITIIEKLNPIPKFYFDSREIELY